MVDVFTNVGIGYTILSAASVRGIALVPMREKLYTLSSHPAS